MLASTIALWWLLSDGAFRVGPEDVVVAGNAIATREGIISRLEGFDRSPNALRLRADAVLEDLRKMPELHDASVSVSLPSEVRIAVEEREPLFVWTDERSSWIVDGEGVLFARPDVAGVSVSRATGRHDGTLPTITDRRIPDAPLAAGAQLDPIDLAAMTHLLALDPDRLGSDAAELRLSVDESFGYVLRSPDHAWQARFGHYTPTLYPPSRIAHQVQCLASLLERGEDRIGTVWLIPTDDACGTFEPARIG